MEAMLKKIDLTVDWLSEKVNELKSKGLVVGISGGIDSAVVAYLIKKAFPENSLGVILPIKSNPQDVEHANLLVHKCRIESMNINLTQTHELLFNEIKNTMSNDQLWNPTYRKISDANLRARLRMSTLYTIANNLGYMVVGTDNKAEVYTGYFTKYGDGGVDLLPIANLLKREVYEWAKVLGVPNEIINKAPSAGLWEGQTDELEMGTTYDYIDAYISGNEIPEKDRVIIDKLHISSEHKRSAIPTPPIF